MTNLLTHSFCEIGEIMNESIRSLTVIITGHIILNKKMLPRRLINIKKYKMQTSDRGTREKVQGEVFTKH